MANVTLQIVGGGGKNMGDMLVKLYDLPETAPGIAELESLGIRIKQALPQNKHTIVDYVRNLFGQGWASECEVCFSNKPVSCFVALDGDKVIGFACYEATCLDFFGPTGVSPEYRGKGIGTALLFKCLLSMRELGYAYAIIGGVDDAAPFYQKAVGAIMVDGSFPGVYERAIGIEKFHTR